jgi:hypothetical protein
MPGMTWLRIQIVGFVDESFPGFIRCAFADADGNRHTFIEKIPVVTTENLWRDSAYPHKGKVPCENVETVEDGSGLARITIGVGDSTDTPGHSEQFIVRESQLSNE